MKTQKSTVFFVILTAFCLFTACEQPDDPVSTTVPQTVAKPTATPAGGNYTSAQTVRLTTTTAGADIHYTLNGITPTANSTKYSSTSAITISATSTLKAIAVKTGMTNSDILTATYTITLPGQVVKPTATPAEGNYTTAQTVRLTTTTAGADIHYTLDGTTPTATSTLYSSAITISETKTLKAIAVKSGMTNSDILTATYTIGCIITFYADGGTPAPTSPITVSLLSTIAQAPPIMTKTWHTFDNWYTDSGFTVPAVFPITVYDHINLYAKWIVNLTNIAEVTSYLASLSANTVNNPASLTLNIDLGIMTEANSGWRQLLDAVNTAGKYVNLDLSSCTMSGTSFNPDSTVTTGKDKIVSLVLPTVATSTAAGSPTDPTFKNFTNLKSISGAYVTTIGSSAFYSSSFSGNTILQNAEFPRVTNIGSFAFSSCKGLQSVNFPQVNIVDIGAFEDCTSIQSVSFPLATSIGDSAFNGCTGLQSASFPASANVGQISTYSNPFQGCTSLTSFTLSGSGSLTVIESGKALVRNGTILLAYPTASGTVTMNTITAIGGSAFYRCTGLQSVSFPQATTIGSMAFYRCTGLQSANFPLVTSIGFSTFDGCSALQSVVFSNATSIGSSTFSGCTSLQSASFSQVTSIDSMAFYLCTSLQSLNIPKVTSIGMFAFGQAGNTTLSITMGNAAPTLAREIFTYVNSAKIVTVKVPSGATGYTPFTGTTVTVSGTNTTANWANGLRGGSWNGTTWADTSSGGTAAINQNISVIIQQQ